jgi:hypothetical protein
MPVASVSYFTGAGQPAFTTATSVGLPQYLEPLPGSTEFAGVRQKMWQVATYYAPPTLSTVATYFATTCYLTGDSSFQEVGGGVMEFTREWLNVPSTIITPNGTVTSSVAYFQYESQQFFRGVPSLKKSEFFRVGSGLTYTDASKIPVLNPNSYFLVTGGFVSQVSLTGPGSALDFQYLLQPTSTELHGGDIYRRDSIYISGA